MLSHAQERRLLELFDRAALKRLAYLGDEATRFFRTTRSLPHFDAVETARAKAVSSYFWRIHYRQRSRDHSLDTWILSCWTHHGLWALSNADRMHLLNVWLERIRRGVCSERASFKALDSEDAFRKRVARLKGLIGWSAFPNTYREAPLRCDPLHRSIEPVSAWQKIFTDLTPGRGEGVDIKQLA